MTTLAEGIRAGLGLAAAWLIIWTIVLSVIPPEPAVFLAEVRVQPAQPVDLGGMAFDLRTCADCPAFLLFDRGLGSPENAIPTSLPVAWSWPALQFSSRQASLGVREVSPTRFVGLLVVQWLILGVAIRGSCKLAGALRLRLLGRRTRG